MVCEFQRFHYKEENKFDFSCIYGNIRIGVVFFNDRDETYFCIDILNLYNHQQLHMDRCMFDKCVNRLTELTAPNIRLPSFRDGDLRIAQIPLTDTYKIVHKNQRIIVDINTIEYFVGVNFDLRCECY